MNLLACGLNHKTAPLSLRERLAVKLDTFPNSLSGLLAGGVVQEAALLSTCNRTELYCAGRDPEALLAWMRQQGQLDEAQLRHHIYLHHDEAAVRHILRVATGLDSLVLGEPQILGQIKSAYRQALEVGTVGRQLQYLFQHVFSFSKHVRTDTAIGTYPVSVAFAAVTLAKQIFEQLSNQKVLLIGSGETIALTADYLQNSGVKELWIANRTLSKAAMLAQQYPNANAITLADIPTYLASADITVTATASTLPILGKGAVESAIKARKHKPMFMVDLAVPRDIEPQVGQLPDVYLYCVDDLQGYLDDNLKERQMAAIDAEKIIELQTQHFMKKLQVLDINDTICQYRDKLNMMRDDSMEKALGQLDMGMDPKIVLQQFARNLTNKVMHIPSVKLRQAAYDGDYEQLKQIRQLFNLHHRENKK